jgi:hypothetical protein
MKTFSKNKSPKKNQTEIKRILKANICKCKVGEDCNCGRLEESNTIFARKFLFNLVKEADELDSEKNPEQFDDQGDKQAFNDALNPETPEGQFDVEGLDPSSVSKNIEVINAWSEKLDEFANFLNDPGTQSLHKILADADRPGTLLKGITRKSSDAITRIAGEITKLKEVLNSFVILAPKKQRDAEQYRGG